LGEQAIQIKGPQCLLHLTGETGFRYFHMSMLKWTRALSYMNVEWHILQPFWQ